MKIFDSFYIDIVPSNETQKMPLAGNRYSIIDLGHEFWQGRAVLDERGIDELRVLQGRSLQLIKTAQSWRDVTFRHLVD